MSNELWTARVHTSGDRIQLLKNGSVTKIIRAGADTFQTKTAKEFAAGLVTKLNAKCAKQMTNPGAEPDVDTKGEEQSVALKAVNTDAKGKSVKEASIADENIYLKKKIAKLEKEAMVEKKARRALAIVKTLVGQNKIANDAETIKKEAMKITAMSTEEVALLEKKVAGIKLYASEDDAATAGRRFARKSRLHRQAAEDAEVSGDEDTADEEDSKAARCESLAKEAFNVANEYAQYKAEADKGTSTDVAAQIKDQPKGVDAQGKKIASDESPDDVGDGDNELIDDVDEEDEFDDDDFSDEDMEIEAAAAIYKKIAADHKKKAEELETAGNKEAAVTENEIAGEAEQMANSVIATKTADDEEDDEDDDDEKYAAAASIYKKIAAEHRKKADDLEAEGKTDEADVEDEIADEAEQLASTVEASMAKTSDDDDDAKKCGDDGKKCDDDAKPIESMESFKTAEPAVASVDTGKVEDAAKPEMTAEIKAATDADDSDAKKTDDVIDAPKDDDPLASLLDEDTKEASEEPAGDADDAMPSDEEINAAVAGDIDEDEADDVGEIEPDDTDKEAGKKDTKKIANEGHTKVASDRIEHNDMAGDSQVQELESLWRKTE